MIRLSLSLSRSLSLSLSHALAFSPTHTLSHTHSLVHSPSHTHSLCFTAHALSLSLTRPLSLLSSHSLALLSSHPPRSHSLPNSNFLSPPCVPLCVFRQNKAEMEKVLGPFAISWNNSYDDASGTATPLPNLGKLSLK